MKLKEQRKKYGKRNGKKIIRGNNFGLMDVKSKQGEFKRDNNAGGDLSVCALGSCYIPSRYTREQIYSKFLTN